MFQKSASLSNELLECRDQKQSDLFILWAILINWTESGTWIYWVTIKILRPIWRQRGLVLLLVGISVIVMLAPQAPACIDWTLNDD